MYCVVKFVAQPPRKSFYTVSVKVLHFLLTLKQGAEFHSWSVCCMRKQNFKTRSLLGVVLVCCLVATVIISPSSTDNVQAQNGTAQATIVPSPTSFTAVIPAGPIKHIVFFIKENRT